MATYLCAVCGAIALNTNSVVTDGQVIHRACVERRWYHGNPCPACRHYLADHAACSTEPGGGGRVVECVCAHACHFAVIS